jgi:hypothetical protein
MTKQRVYKLILLAAIAAVGGACNPAKTVNNNSGSSTSAPTISSFSASPAGIAFGDSTTLTWSASNFTLLYINPDVGYVAGASLSVSPANTITYTLTASGPGGTANASTTVTVKTIATLLSYTDPTSGTYKLVRNATKSTSTHLVLDLLGPAGSLSGVGLCLSADPTKINWVVVDAGDTERVKNSAFSNAIVKSKTSTDGVLQAGIYQKGITSAINATSSTVLASVALELTSTATITKPRTVALGAVSGKTVILNPPGSGSTTSPITIATGTLTAS